MRNFTYSILILVLVISCNKSDDTAPSIPATHPLIGYWTSTEMEGDVFVMTRSDEFQQDRYGFAFFSDSRYYERKNSCGCGTPPIVFQTYDGIWKFVSDDLYEIEVGFWGGTVGYQIEVIYLDEQTLKCRFNYQVD